MTRSTLTPPTSVAPLGRLPETRSARSEAARATPGLRRHRLPIAACALGLAAVGLQSQDASGAIMVTVQQQGANVVIEYSGFWDTWASDGIFDVNDRAVYGQGLFNASGADLAVMASSGGGMSLDSGSWTNVSTSADSVTGDELGWNSSFTYAPLGYTAGDPIAGSMTFNNTDLATMGFTPGDSGSWSGGAGTVNFTVTASAVPGAGLAGLATVGLAGVARRRRR